MITGTLCSNCGLKEAKRYWHTGAALCNECYEEWDRKEKYLRTEVINELNGNWNW